VAAITVYSAPEDGRKGRPKHVEHVVFNKQNTTRVASCWFIIYYRKYLSTENLRIQDR